DEPHLQILARSESLQSVVKNQGARKFEVFRDGDEVVILEVVDNGCGIQNQDSNRVFDPFFTTKATGVGTGLGLSVARKIVDLHGGELSLANREGEQGAVARMILPTKMETSKVKIKSKPLFPKRI